jgi:hypothetical protein
MYKKNRTCVKYHTFCKTQRRDHFFTMTCEKLPGQTSLGLDVEASGNMKARRAGKNILEKRI